MKGKVWIAVLIGGIVTGESFLQTVEARGRGRSFGRKASAENVVALSAEEEADLLLMREEEKLARDVYLTLYEAHGLRVFRNISWSEQRHMNAVLSLLEKYGIEDPASSEVGVFNNPELQELYNTLTESGLTSASDALKVGALIEEVDIDDLLVAMNRTQNEDILRIYNHLNSGSENHLRAFVRNIESTTNTLYQAQWLPQETVDSILGR
jgi:hypothetical protein